MIFEATNLDNLNYLHYINDRSLKGRTVPRKLVAQRGEFDLLICFTITAVLYILLWLFGSFLLRSCSSDETPKILKSEQAAEKYIKGCLIYVGSSTRRLSLLEHENREEPVTTCVVNSDGVNYFLATPGTTNDFARGAVIEVTFYVRHRYTYTLESFTLEDLDGKKTNIKGTWWLEIRSYKILEKPR